MNDITKEIIASIVCFLLIIGFIVWAVWFFPSSSAYNYQWGKQVCILVKPEKSFIRTMFCTEPYSNEK